MLSSLTYGVGVCIRMRWPSTGEYLEYSSDWAWISYIGYVTIRWLLCRLYRPEMEPQTIGWRWYLPKALADGSRTGWINPTAEEEHLNILKVAALLFIMPVQHLKLEMRNLETMYLRWTPQVCQHFQKKADHSVWLIPLYSIIIECNLGMLLLDYKMTS